MGLTVGLSLHGCSVVFTVESLYLLYLHFYILIIMYLEMMYRQVKDLSCKPTSMCLDPHLN